MSNQPEMPTPDTPQLLLERKRLTNHTVDWDRCSGL
jgi:hypothetical protein